MVNNLPNKCHVFRFPRHRKPSMRSDSKPISGVLTASTTWPKSRRYPAMFLGKWTMNWKKINSRLNHMAAQRSLNIWPRPNASFWCHFKCSELAMYLEASMALGDLLIEIVNHIIHNVLVLLLFTSDMQSSLCSFTSAWFQINWKYVFMTT